MAMTGEIEEFIEDLREEAAERLVEEFEAIVDDAETDEGRWGDEDYGDDDRDEAEIDEYAAEEMWDEGAERGEELGRETQCEVIEVPLEILAEYALPKLPAGVAVTGGIARSMARETIAGVTEPVRALELTFIPELGKDADEKMPNEAELEELAKKYMAEDYIHGRGVAERELAKYFTGQEFTANQCLVYGDKIVLTQAAIEDLAAGVVRPTYGAQPNAETETKERTFMRALLMAATVDATEAEARLEDFALEEIWRKIDEREGEGADLRMEAFEIALTLNKAMSRGAEVAMELVDIFVEHGIVDEWYEGKPLQLARRTRDLGAEFEFRPLEGCPDEDREYERGEDERFMDERYLAKKAETWGRDEKPKVKTKGRKHAAKSAEKTEAEIEMAKIMARAAEAGIEEIATGEYTADDYDWVNRTGAYKEFGALPERKCPND